MGRLERSSPNASLAKSPRPGRGPRPASTDNGRKWAILLTVILMVFMPSLDTSIVNVALPTIQRELGVTAVDIQWASSAYLLVCCAAVLVLGKLSDSHGMSRIFNCGTAAFTLGSLLCGMSSTLPALIAGRVVQGLGAAGAMATCMGIATAAFPPHERGRALGIIALFTSLGLMCGPALGGFLVAAFPWESIFLVNAPIGIAAFALGLKTQPHDRRPRTIQGLDALGAVLASFSVVALFLAVTGASASISPLVVGELAAGAILLVAFVVRELTCDAPLVDLRLLRQSGFTLNLLATFFNFVAVGGSEYLLPFFLQEACDYPSQTAGAVLMAIPAAMAVMSPIAGALADRFGAERPSIAGCALYAAGIAVVGCLPPSAGIPAIVAATAVMSAGTGLFQSPNNALVMGAVDERHLGFAGSMVALARCMGMSVGVAGSTVLLSAHMSAAAGRPIRTFAEGGAELFSAGYSFTFWMLAAVVAAGLACAVVAAALSRRR